MSAVYIVAIIGFLYVLQVAVACWEKRMVWPYGAPEPAPRWGDPTAYGYRQVSEAISRGFMLSGWCPDLKGEMYKLSYALLASQDHYFVVIVGVGSMAGMQLQSTWIYSRAADKKLYYTVDHQNGVEIDISGNVRCQLASMRAFTAQLDRHIDWLRSTNIEIQPFDPGNEIECFRELRSARFDDMLKRGLIRFDSTQTWWRYTLLGAMKSAAMNYTVGLARAVTFGAYPRSA